MSSFAGSGLGIASRFLVQVDMDFSRPFLLVLETEAKNVGRDGLAMIFPP